MFAPPPTLPGFEHIRRYYRVKWNCNIATLKPGECYVTHHAELISTVLGSCISACIRAPELKLGGMNHFMLPHTPGRALNDSALRYGNFAMELLLNELLKRGANRQHLEVKLFGGASLQGANHPIGLQNVQFAIAYLEEEGIEVTAHDLGGAWPRKIIYEPITGKIKVKRLHPLDSASYTARESQYQRSLNQQPIAGEVELF